MEALRNIGIDLDVHKTIENSRETLEESENEILRRLLGIEPKERKIANPRERVGGRAWSGKGVTLPHGTELQMEYNGVVLSGRIDQGEWLVDDKRASSPSAAAKCASTTKEGGSPSLNGWIYWRVKKPGESRWVRLEELRPK